MFGVVAVYFFVSKSLLGIERQKKPESLGAMIDISSVAYCDINQHYMYMNMKKLTNSCILS